MRRPLSWSLPWCLGFVKKWSSMLFYRTVSNFIKVGQSIPKLLHFITLQYGCCRHVEFKYALSNVYTLIKVIMLYLCFKFYSNRSNRVLRFTALWLHIKCRRPPSWIFNFSYKYYDFHIEGNDSYLCSKFDANRPRNKEMAAYLLKLKMAVAAILDFSLNASALLRINASC